MKRRGFLLALLGAACAGPGLLRRMGVGRKASGMPRAGDGPARQFQPAPVIIRGKARFRILRLDPEKTNRPANWGG